MNSKGTGTRQAVVDQQRRSFFKQVGAAGAVGAMGGSLLLPADALAQAAPGATDFERPKGLLPGAMLDSRFPVAFAATVTQGLALVLAYFTAQSQRDIRALAKTLHFPFAIYEFIEPIVYQTAEEFLANPPPSLTVATASNAGRVMPGSYDLLESCNVHLYCPVGGAFSLSFNRYKPDGDKLFRCDGLYSVTNNDGRWAIQLVSTMIHEPGYENHEYPDAELTDRLGSQGYLAAFGYRDEALLNDLSKGRGSYESRLPVGTRTASVNLGYGPRERTRDARNNDPMRGWKYKGVRSRLQVSEITAQERPEFRTNLNEFVELAGGTVGKYDYTRINPTKPLVIHATHDKAHVLSGYTRFTADSQVISETRGVGIRIRKAGNWGSAGGLGQVMHHDLSSSKPPR